MKNLREIIKDEEFEESEEIGVKEKKRRKCRLAWYWLARARFYTFSPIFRGKVERRTKVGDSGWGFVGSFGEEDVEYLKWLESKGIV